MGKKNVLKKLVAIFFSFSYPRFSFIFPDSTQITWGQKVSEPSGEWNNKKV